MATTQHQLVGEAQRVVPLQSQAPLLLACAALAVIVARQRRPPGLARGVLDLDLTATDLLTGYQVHLHLVGRQPVELVHQLLQLPQVEQLPGITGKGHVQFARGETAAIGRLDAFELALHHQDGQGAPGKILLRQIGPAGDVASLQIGIGNGLEQGVELIHAQASTQIGLGQALAITLGELLGPL